MTKNSKMTVSIKPFCLAEKEFVAIKWQALEQKANCSVFLSWLWIGNWLDLVTDKLFLIECHQGENVVGLGFFVEKTRKIFGVIPVKQWWLHKTGNTEQDQIWTEHNDFLLAEDTADVVRLAMVEALYNYDNQKKEIVVGLSSDKVLQCFYQHFSQSNSLVKTLGYVTDFSYIKTSYQHEVLSKNTRAQINRSNKILNQLGNLAFNVVTEKAEVNALYKDIARIHIERWGNTKEGSGFSNKVFTTFHQQLVNNDAASTVQIAVLLLNNSPIGYLVNFVYKQKVYFYLSALTTFSNSKIKVGLTLHEKAISYYASQGMKSYDFLGGEARYKRSLSNQSYKLSMYSFYKNNLLLMVESKLKHVKVQIKLWLLKPSR